MCHFDNAHTYLTTPLLSGTTGCCICSSYFLCLICKLIIYLCKVHTLVIFIKERHFKIKSGPRYSHCYWYYWKEWFETLFSKVMKYTCTYAYVCTYIYKSNAYMFIYVAILKSWIYTETLISNITPQLLSNLPIFHCCVTLRPQWKNYPNIVLQHVESFFRNVKLIPLWKTT